VSIEFVPATRAAQKARVALTGPSGAGKTYTGLVLAHRLAGDGRLGVIDTERGKAQMYKGLNGWDWDTYNPPSFAPAALTEALGVAAGRGFSAVLLDSWSHYWSGTDGMLEQVDKRATGGNNFSGWKEVRPEERRMIDAIVSYPGHIVVTLRVKTEYVVEQVERRGRIVSVPRKVGLKPEQRDGTEYEFDVIGDMDLDNVLTVSKTRIPMLHGSVITQPGTELADTIADWLADGEDVPGPLTYRSQALDPDATVDDLLALHAIVKAAGLLNAPMVDADNNPTVLGQLIVARGKTLQAAAS
jgi:hypothetical protein